MDVIGQFLLLYHPPSEDSSPSQLNTRLCMVRDRTPEGVCTLLPQESRVPSHSV